MLPTTFKEVNKIMLKPLGMGDEECGDLPVYKGLDANGFPIIISCWKLSREDLEEIKKGGVIWLSIMGNPMPPVSVFIENPF